MIASAGLAARRPATLPRAGRAGQPAPALAPTPSFPAGARARATRDRRSAVRPNSMALHDAGAPPAPPGARPPPPARCPLGQALRRLASSLLAGAITLQVLAPLPADSPFVGALPGPVAEALGDSAARVAHMLHSRRSGNQRHY